ncbi:DegV family protein [Tissierella carlieri]|uniref:DegV family protein n=1 Tax=Tissierella carlieri TaxID=689904 RepID=UPI0038653FCF
MSKFVLTCCSTADMPYEYFLKRDIPFASFHFNMDGKEYIDDLGQTMSFEEFYSRIEGGAMPTTSQVNVGEFIDLLNLFLRSQKIFCIFLFLQVYQVLIIQHVWQRKNYYLGIRNRKL